MAPFALTILALNSTLIAKWSPADVLLMEYGLLVSSKLVDSPLLIGELLPCRCFVDDV